MVTLFSIYLAQVLSRGSRSITASGRLQRSRQLSKANSIGDGTSRPRQTNLELEVVAVGIGLRFVELDEGKQVCCPDGSLDDILFACHSKGESDRE
jgi:hypothetical protein